MFNGILSKDGTTSSTRVGMFMCIVAAIAYSFIGLYIIATTENTGLSLVEVNLMVGTFLGAGFAGKGIGAHFETKQKAG